MKYFILQIHKWLGIISGIVVFIVSITGAIFTFQDNIKDALYDYRKVNIEQKVFLQPSKIIDIVKTKNPKLDILRVMYMDKDRSTVVMTADEKKDYYMVYVNPYSGKILYQENFKDDFFIVIQYIHTSLLLGEIGKQIVAASTVIFIVLLISGLFLWWPKSKNQRKSALKIKWSAKWKRLNYDLHNVLGFYTFGIALILCLTGLSFSYPALKNSYYYIANLGTAQADEQKKNLYEAPKEKLTSYELVDKAYEYSSKHSPNAAMHWVYLPNPDKNPLGVRAYHKSLQYYAMDFYQFKTDQAFEAKELKYENLTAGKKLNNAMYDLHTGIILGTFGKIIAFLVSLIAASLPITGFIIWIKRPKNKKKTNEIKA